ncbi:MAG TPA: EAL domain-containing protein [Clostridiaceae bacterium]|nr:EAL domain-containing protein [Clostridiaceae bacterium]
MSIKILVVEDSATDMLIIKNMLNEYNILTACDGIETMRILEEHDDIDLLILDLNMPNMDGFQVLERLKSDARYRKIRTIILTIYDEIDNEIKGLRLGAVDYIRKPIHMDSLKARIAVHIELLKAHKALEQKLQEQWMTLDLIFYQAPIGIAICYNKEPTTPETNSNCRINPMFEKIAGRKKDELIRLGWAAVTHPEDLEEELILYKKLQSGEISGYNIDKRLIRPDGSIAWVNLIMSRLSLYYDQQCNHICLIQDITERKIMEKALIESERSKSVLLSHLPGLAYRCKYDRNWTMQYISDGCFKLTGYTPESLLNSKDLSYNDLIAPEYREILWEEWERVLSQHLPFKYEYEITTASGERKWVLEMGEGIFNDKGEVESLEGIIIDISDRKAMEDILKYNQDHDRLTGLYNINYLFNLIINDAKKRTIGRRALVGLNLSKVHTLRVVYGFHYTQELVKNLAAALSEHCTENRLLCSAYENLFVFYIKNYKDRDELIEFCNSIANTMVNYLIAERVGAGIGILEIVQEDEADAEQLFKKLLIAAEKAAKQNDKDIGICFYDDKIEMQINREQEITRELEKIASDEENGGLFLQYQMILDLKSNQIFGFEALARLNSDRLGLVPPTEFIAIAEKTKLIIPVGKKIIQKALCFLKKLEMLGYDHMYVTINLSVIQLLKTDFCQELFEMIKDIGVNPANIGLEITESIIFSDFEKVNATLGILKGAGLHILIDDFGTGYSSLSRERELNVDCVKIDKSFIDKLMYLKPERALTSDIISMAHKVGHCVVAEGVEHEEQRKFLLNWGCDRIQGYLISEPLDEDKAIEVLERTYKKNR